MDAQEDAELLAEAEAERDAWFAKLRSELTAARHPAPASPTAPPELPSPNVGGV